MPVNEHKNNFIYGLHPLTQVVYCMTVFFLSLLFSHPFYLAALLAATGVMILTAGIRKEWINYLKIGLFMTVMIVVFNALLSSAGSTNVFLSPVIHGWGRIAITEEAIVYGLAMSLRLLVMMSAFCLYNHVVHPDKALRLLGRTGSKAALAIILAVRLFPLMIQDIRRIVDIQRCRGLKYETVSWLQRIHNLFPVTGILLSTSLERSMQMGASMYARGYGSGQCSCYRSDLWRPRDYLITTASIAGFLLGLALTITGNAYFTYYPSLQPISSQDIRCAMLTAGFYLAPTLVYWGWQQCPQLQSKI